MGLKKEVRRFFFGANKELNKHINIVNRQLNLFRKAIVSYEEPYTEMSQNAKKVLIRIKMPEVKKRDVILRVDGNLVSVRGDRIKGSKLLKGFYKNIRLPQEAMTERVKATFKKNTLKITVPKDLQYLSK